MKNRINIKFLLYIIILIEIALFIIVGRIIGLFFTLLLIIGTTAFGFSILRKQNFAFMMNMQKAFRLNQHPIIDLTEHSIILFSGLLLIIPGFFTDIIGALLLIPSLRSKFLKLLIATNIGHKTAANDHVTIDGECWNDEKDEK